MSTGRDETLFTGKEVIVSYLKSIPLVLDNLIINFTTALYPLTHTQYMLIQFIYLLTLRL